jgi:hypothetical protein
MLYLFRNNSRLLISSKSANIYFLETKGIKETLELYPILIPTTAGVLIYALNLLKRT